MHSPRLKWLKKHNLAIGELPDGQRFCVGESGVGLGDTHRDAELKYAGLAEIEHWSLQEFKKAGVLIPGEAQEEIC